MNSKESKTVEEIINHISNESFLIDLLHKYEIAQVEEVCNIQPYQRGECRQGFIAEIKEPKFTNITKIMIDLRLGQPSVNQVFDALYGVGKDCDIKIILFTGEYNNNDKGIPVADEYLVAPLISELQDNNIPIVLFSIDQDSLSEKYVDIYQDWYSVNRLRSCKIPTKENFMGTTFWCVYFDSFSECFYDPWTAYNGLLNGGGNGNYIIYIDEFIHGEIRLLWDDKCAGYEIKQTSESDEYLKKVLDIKMPALKEKYGEDSVRFENLVGKLPRLYINYSSKPFDWLFSATPNEITDFAEGMYNDAWNLRWMIEGAVEELYQVDYA